MTAPSIDDACGPSAVPSVIRTLIWCGLCASVPVLVLRETRPKGAPTAEERAAPGPQATNDRIWQADEAKPVRDVARTISELKAANPDYVGIGNSMLYTRLGTTPEAMNALTGKKFFFINKNGSSSAAWYLTLKNIVAASGTHPKLVFFFIRDNDLTSPFYRTDGEGAVYLNSLRGAQEPVLDGMLRLVPVRQGLMGNVSRWLNGPGGIYHFPAWDDKLPRKMIDMAMDAGSHGLSKKEMRGALSARFALTHLRRDVAADIPAAGSVDGSEPDSFHDTNRNFRNPEENSFLPAMMKVARDQGIKLLFFRIKRRPDQQGNVSSEPPELRPYAEHLKHWIEEQGGLFFDESYDPAIPESAYQDGDHIGDDHIDWYRAYFWKRMAPFFL